MRENSLKAQLKFVDGNQRGSATGWIRARGSRIFAVCFGIWLTFVSPTTSLAQANPTVSLTATCVAPCNEPANVNLSAAATAASGRAIARVEFYSGTALLATDTSSPYTFVATGVSGGNKSFTAKVFDNAATPLSAASAAKTVLVNAAPVVSISAACSANPCVSGSTVSLSANASDPNGSVTKVEFYRGTTLIATRTAAPWSHSDANAPAGTLSYTAKAFDNATTPAVTTSTAVSVIVSGTAPTISLVATCAAPCNAPATITLTATAAVAAGLNIAKVEFYEGSTLRSTKTAAPYTLTLTNKPGGAYGFTAKVFDNGAVVKSTVSSVAMVAVNAAPTVTLATSCNASPCSAPATIALTATPADADGSITKVEFYRGSTLVATKTDAPWTVSDPGLVAGTYSFTAKAYDNAATSLVTTSGAKSVTVGASTTTMFPIAIDGAAVDIALPGSLPPVLTFDAVAGDVLTLRVVSDTLPSNNTGVMVPMGNVNLLGQPPTVSPAALSLSSADVTQSYAFSPARFAARFSTAYINLFVRTTGRVSVRLADYDASPRTLGFKLIRSADALAVPANGNLTANNTMPGQSVRLRFSSPGGRQLGLISLEPTPGWNPRSGSGLADVYYVDVWRPNDDSFGYADVAFPGSFQQRGPEGPLLNTTVFNSSGDLEFLVTPLRAVVGGVNVADRRPSSPSVAIQTDGSEIEWRSSRAYGDGATFEFQAVAGKKYTLIMRCTESKYRYVEALADGALQSALVHPACSPVGGGLATGMFETNATATGTARISFMESQVQANPNPIYFSVVEGFVPELIWADTTQPLRPKLPYFNTVRVNGQSTEKIANITVYAYKTGGGPIDSAVIANCSTPARAECSFVYESWALKRPNPSDPRPVTLYAEVTFVKGITRQSTQLSLTNAARSA